MHAATSALKTLTLLHNDQVQGGEVGADDAATHRLAAALALPAAVAEHTGISWGHEQPDAKVGHDTLTHGEALFVLATLDLKHVSLELLRSKRPMTCQG